MQNNLTLVQVQLMVRLGIIPLPSWNYLRCEVLLPPFLLYLLSYVFGDALLLLVMEENSATVLGSSIRALAVEGCRVVHLVEEF